MTLLAIWLGYICRQAHWQRRVVNQIHALGGTAAYDYQFDENGERLKDASPPGWHWLRERIGDEYFQEIVEVHLNQTDATDADLEMLASYSGLRALHLDGTNISDAGLAHVEDLRELRRITLRDTKITGEGLRHLQNMHRLEVLNLGETNVDGDGLSHLTELANLQHLALDSTSVDSHGFLKLGDLSNLTLLTLGDTHVDDAVVPRLAGMTRLDILQLCDTSISGEGLLRLKAALPELVMCDADFLSLRGSSVFDDGVTPRRRQVLFDRIQMLHDEGRLKAIDLSDTQLADEHLSLLAGLDHVEIIDVRGTRASEAGLAQLQHDLPNVEFRRDAHDD
jgi:hypothetical protein